MLEADTIKKFIEGDLAAFEAIYCTYSPKATWFAVKYVCSEEVAKDIVHDVFLSIWDSRRNLNPDYPVEPYIMTSVRNRCLNYLRDNISRTKAGDTLQKRILREDPNDVRWGLVSNERGQQWWLMKHPGPRHNTAVVYNNYPVVRVSEVYLIAAEAAVKGGGVHLTGAPTDIDWNYEKCILPIPVSQFELNPDFQQNPGYSKE